MEYTRNATTANGGLTDQEWINLREHHRHWCSVVSRTHPTDPDKAISQIQMLYAAASLARPKVVIVSSPGVMAFAGVLGKAILKKRADDHSYSPVLPDVNSIKTNEKYAPLIKGVLTALAEIISISPTAHEDVENIDLHRRILDATYCVGDQHTAAAMDRKTNMDIRESLDHLPLNDLGYAIEEAMKEPFGNSSLTALMKTNVEDWGIEIARRIFNTEDEAVSAANSVCDWWTDSQAGAASTYYDYCITAARDVLGIQIPGTLQYQIWEQCTKDTVYRYLHPEFCLVCDFPSKVVDKKLESISVGSGQNFYYWNDGWSV